MNEQLSFFPVSEETPEIRLQECKPKKNVGRPRKENKKYQEPDGFAVRRKSNSIGRDSKSLLENDYNKLEEIK